MSIEKVNFDSIGEEDIQELLDAQVPEGLRLEYKRVQFGASDSEKRELLKDVTAFANSHGGHLILGIGESDGAAIEIAGLNIDVDAEIVRMEQIIHNATEPPVSGLRIRGLTMPNDNKIILIRIPKSWYPPHRVAYQGVKRFYTRHSAGVHEPSVEELRAMFNQSTSAIQMAREFRDKRIELVANGEGPRPLEGNGRLFVHVVPISAFSGAVQLDLGKVQEVHQMFWPIASNGLSPGYNVHGYINERGGDSNNGYVQIFRNGILEATKANIVRESGGNRIIPGSGLETSFFQRFGGYMDGLRNVGVPAPLIFMMTFEGAKDVKYAVLSREQEDFDQLPLPNNVLSLPECIIEEYGEHDSYHRAIRPAFDALWNAIGYPKSYFFNDDGIWTGGQ